MKEIHRYRCNVSLTLGLPDNYQVRRVVLQILERTYWLHSYSNLYSLLSMAVQRIKQTNELM